MRLSLRTPLPSALCAIAVSVTLAACGSSSPSRSTPVPAHRTQLLSILQSDALLDGNPAPVMAAAKALGAQVIRYNVLWSAIAPDPGSRTRPAGFAAADPAAKGYNWAALDSIVSSAKASGIKLYLTLTSPAPLWATAENPPPSKKCGLCQHWEPSSAEYGQWVTAVAKRYSGSYTPPGQPAPLPRVSFWSLWNEPNYGPNLAPQATRRTINGAPEIVDLAAPAYRKLVNAGWKALLATGHTPVRDTIVIGETAPRGQLNPGIDNMTPPLQFLRDLYCVSDSYAPLTGAAATAEGCSSDPNKASFAADDPALFKADGWADHPYPDGVPPNEKAGEPSQTEGFADFARLSNLEDSLQRAAAAWGLHTKMPIYNTEFGYFTSPPANLKTQIGTVPLATAARDLNWAEYLTWKNPDIASYDQYLLQDPGPTSGSDFYTAIEFFNGKPKPDVYAAYRLPLWLPTTGSDQHTLQVWGCARPVLDSHTLSHSVAIQFAASGAAYRTIKRITLQPASDGCYFQTSVTFPASGNVRLAYRNGAGVETSRVQPITLR